MLALLGEVTDFSAGLVLMVEAGSAGSPDALPCLEADSMSQDVDAAGMRIFLCPSLCNVHGVGLVACPGSVGLGQGCEQFPVGSFYGHVHCREEFISPSVAVSSLEWEVPGAAEGC